MDEVAGPVIAISLVLMAVFIPCAFIARESQVSFSGSLQ
jgi:multidrug efflux pump subunit AcrB